MPALNFRSNYVAEQLRGHVMPSTSRVKGRSLRCYNASDAIECLVASGHAADPSSACEMGRIFVTQGKIVLLGSATTFHANAKFNFNILSI